jgi:hypothetical protein
MKTMTIKNTAGMSFRQLEASISNGGKFIVYGYCVSIIALTFRLTSDPFFIKKEEDPAKYRGPYTLLSLVMGWWGIPWGPVYTVDMIRINKKCGGGIDVTAEVMPKLFAKYGKGSEADKPQEAPMNIEFAPNELTR